MLRTGYGAAGHEASVADAMTQRSILSYDVEASGDWLGVAPSADRKWLESVYDTDELLRLATSANP